VRWAAKRSLNSVGLVQASRKFTNVKNLKEL